MSIYARHNGTSVFDNSLLSSHSTLMHRVVFLYGNLKFPMFIFYRWYLKLMLSFQSSANLFISYPHAPCFYNLLHLSPLVSFTYPYKYVRDECGFSWLIKTNECVFSTINYGVRGINAIEYSNVLERLETSNLESSTRFVQAMINCGKRYYCQVPLNLHIVEWNAPHPSSRHHGT